MNPVSCFGSIISQRMQLCTRRAGIRVNVRASRFHATHRPIILLLDNHRTRWTNKVRIDCPRVTSFVYLLGPRASTGLGKEQHPSLIASQESHLAVAGTCTVLYLLLTFVQPLDVGVFAHFKRALREAAEDWADKEKKSDISWMEVVAATAAAFTTFDKKALIQSAFRATGLLPQDRTLIFDKIAKFSAPWQVEKAAKAAEEKAAADAVEAKRAADDKHQEVAPPPLDFLTSVPPALRTALDVQQLVDKYMKRKRRGKGSGEPHGVLFDEPFLQALAAARAKAKEEKAEKKSSGIAKKAAALEKKSTTRKRKRVPARTKSLSPDRSRVAVEQRRAAVKKTPDALSDYEGDSSSSDSDGDEDDDEDTAPAASSSSCSSSSSSTSTPALSSAFSQCCMCSARIRPQRGTDVPLCRDCKADAG